LWRLWSWQFQRRRENPHAREFAIKERTMGRLVKEDLGLHVYKRTPRQALSIPDVQKRLQRAKILLNKLEKKKADTVIIGFLASL